MRTVLAVALTCVAVTGSGVTAPVAQAAEEQIVRTQSGKMRCLVMINDSGHGGGPAVACQAAFTNAPRWSGSPSGEPMNIATVRYDGSFNWDIGNIPGSSAVMANDIEMAYGSTYNINGWTVLPTFDGTRFTNDATGRGMFVSIDQVYSF